MFIIIYLKIYKSNSIIYNSSRYMQVDIIKNEVTINYNNYRIVYVKKHLIFLEEIILGNFKNPTKVTENIIHKRYF